MDKATEQRLDALLISLTLIARIQRVTRAARWSLPMPGA